MHMINDKGEAVYFNPIRKNGATWPSTALGPIDFSAGKNAPGNT